MSEEIRNEVTDDTQLGDTGAGDESPENTEAQNTETPGSPQHDGGVTEEQGGVDSEVSQRPELGGGDSTGGLPDSGKSESPLDSNEDNTQTGDTEQPVPGDSIENEDNSAENEETEGEATEDVTTEEEPQEPEMPMLYPELSGALEYITQETKKIQKEITELKNREITRLGTDFEAFMIWARKREKIQPLDDLFYAFDDAYKKARALVEPLKPYIDSLIYNDVLFSAGLHYIICEPYFYDDLDEEGEEVEKENPLYVKYGIGAKAYIISSASDESSSSSIHATKSLNDGDFIMQDLLRTRYGTWVYSILEQLDIGAVLL